MGANQGYQGFQNVTGFGSEFNAQLFLIQSVLATVRTATLVQVQSCTNAGGIAAVGTVNVLPLTNMVDAAGNQTPHGTLYSLQYARVQGGANAVVIDPVAGDIGLAVFADRDVSSVIANKGQANPGSNRMFDMADGIYLFSVLTKAPTQYVQFDSAGISVTSTGKVTLTDGKGSTVVLNGDDTGSMTFSGGLTVNANVQVNGAVTATGEGTFNGGHTVSQHTHTQGDDSHGDTEQPTNKPTG